jgi:hypothetical protein
MFNKTLNFKLFFIAYLNKHHLQPKKTPSILGVFLSIYQPKHRYLQTLYPSVEQPDHRYQSTPPAEPRNHQTAAPS